jgi:hypothetical protein
MRTVRLLAIATLALLGLYFVMRGAAGSCAGAACDIYIPLSLLLPILILMMVTVTGLASTSGARRQGAWFAVLLGCTVLGIAGPVVALLIFRDRPDMFVTVATVLEILVPLAALSFSFLRREQRVGAP